MNVFIKKDTGYFFIITKKFYYKIPLELKSFLNLFKENKNISNVKIDTFFKNFLGESKYYYFCRKICKYSKLSGDKDFLEKFKKDFFKKNLKLKKKKIKDFDFFDHIENFLMNEKKKLNFLKKKIGTLQILETQCHGDFYYKNILRNKNNIILIDWNNYQKKGSIYFDLINFLVFSKKNYKGSWFQSWKNNYHMLNAKFPKKYVNSYVLWKVSQDLASQKTTHRLRNKMTNIVNNFTIHLKKENF
jgi:hypothetical protein